MITTELFILLKLFTVNNVSWWWTVLFFFSDGAMWFTVRKMVRNSNEK